MTVLNFPASPAVNDTYTANNVTYTWNGSYWDANNTTSLDDIYVEVSGDSMTGNLLLPGGGGNTAALQKQEIEDLPVSTFDNDRGYITSADIPPGTVSYWNKVGDTLEPVSDTDNVDIGNGNITLTAADGSITTAGAIKIEDRVNGTGLLSTTSVNNWSIQATQDSGSQAKGLYLRATGEDGTRQDGLFIKGATTGAVATVQSFGDFTVGTLPSAPAITLAENGSIVATGKIESDRTDATTTILRGRLAGTETSVIRADGSASFASGDFTVLKDDDKGCQLNVNRTAGNEASATFVSSLAGSTTSAIRASGSAEFSDTLKVGITGAHTASNPAISLEANGSITAAGQIRGDGFITYNSPIQTSNGLGTGYVKLSSSSSAPHGQVDIRGDGEVFKINDSANGNLNALFNGDGSLKIGGTLPSAPNITLAEDGQGEFKGTIWGQATANYFGPPLETTGASPVYVGSQFAEGKDYGYIQAQLPKGIGPTRPVFNIQQVNDAEDAWVQKYRINADGTVWVGGNLDISVPTPNITLEANGNCRAVRFLGFDAASNLAFRSSNADLGSSPSVTTFGVSGAGSLFLGGAGVGPTERTIHLKGEDGSANFKGRVQCDRGGDSSGTTVSQGWSSDYSGSVGTEVGQMLSRGKLMLLDTTIGSFVSERRLKTNITPIDPQSSWETIKNTPYYSYNWKKDPDGSPVYGAIVDEVPSEMVLQSMVEDPKTGVQSVRSDDEGPIRTYDNGMLQARLYTALQSALVRIEELEARLDAAGA